MKYYLFKYILFAKFIVNNKFYWKFETAKRNADKELMNCIVWSINFKPIYRKPTCLWEKQVSYGEGW